jgi:tRNA-binding protein
MDTITWDDFARIDLRVGTIVEAKAFPEAHKPAYILTIDFGETIDTLRSSAQITDLYTLDDLTGMQIVAVVNFPPKQIGPMMSECLVTGFPRSNGDIVLTTPDVPVPNGTRLV